MRVFVTGASGFVGSAVVAELVAAGHKVLGLARSGSSAKKIEALGAKAHMGDLVDISSLKNGIQLCDGVIHTGMNHDFSNWKKSCEQDQHVIDAIGAILAGSNRPVILTSALGILPAGSIATEESRPHANSPNPRVLTEIAARKIIERGVNASIVRLPPSTHGAGDWGFVTMLIKIAKDKGVSVYSDDIQNTWPAVHRLDSAKVFRLALERSFAGSYYHAVAEDGVPFKRIAETIANELEIPLKGMSGADTTSHFGWFSHFAAMNIKAESDATRSVLSWKPDQVDLITDMKQNYFE
ncbi:MAG: SDR family oxidoreductase [Bdellovibrionales bacterium]|nr:SDR family oxidoreductase [Bdellovibrionales bacterium]